jgi:biotin carboxyl carrier protein
MKYVIEVNGMPFEVDINDVSPHGALDISVNGVTREVEMIPGKMVDEGPVLIGRQPFESELVHGSDGFPSTVKVSSHPFQVAISEIGVSRPLPKSGPRLRDGKINAFMSGMVVELCVSINERVSKGQVLLILEAMKMENEILAPFDGIVRKIGVRKGLSAAPGTTLMEIEPVEA